MSSAKPEQALAPAERDPADLMEADDFLESIGLDAPVEDGRIPRSPDLDAKVDRALEKLAEIEREIAENGEVARRRIEMIESWREEENAKLTHRHEWISRRLQLIALGYDFGDKKSRKLPHGTFGFRRSRDTVEVVDEELAVAWAERACPDAVKKRVIKTPLIKWVKESGVIPDGCEWVEGRDEFFVRAAS